MIQSSDDPRQVEAVYSRRTRKQAVPHRSPTNNDAEPGRIFTVAFGMAGSQGSDIQLRRGSQESLFSHCSTGSHNVKDSESVSGYVGNHLMPKHIPDQLGTKLKGGAIRPGRFDNRRRESTLSADSSVHSTITPANRDSLEEPSSLADQYLDTMVMDDKWRALCLETILLNRRQQRSLKKRNTKSTNRQKAGSKVVGLSKQRPARMTSVHIESIPPTPPISPKVAHRKQIHSTRSDSGFISSSPSPVSATYLRLRSTRNYPVNAAPSTISLDLSPSMIGRTCLSCGSANTTCWRRTLGGIICNSCGLRYKKCGIICADVKCRYIPTRSEIRDMKLQGRRAGQQCYACKGNVIAREDNI